MAWAKQDKDTMSQDPGSEHMTTTIHVRNPRTGKNDYEFVPPGHEALRAVCAGLRGAQRRWADFLDQEKE